MKPPVNLSFTQILQQYFYTRPARQVKHVLFVYTASRGRVLIMSQNLCELKRKLSRYCSQDIVRHSFEKYVVFSCSEFKDNQYRFNFGENGGTTIKAILRKSQMRLLARKLYSQLLLLEFRPLWQAHTEGTSCVRGLFGRLWCLVALLN